MFKVLRIICCVIAALCVAACVFVFVYCGAIWGVCCLLAAIVFFAFTVLFKSLQEDAEKKAAAKQQGNASDVFENTTDDESKNNG